MTDRRLEELERVAGSVSRETFERLILLEDLFIKWSRRINLAAPSTLDHLWHRHILDSAQLLKYAGESLDWVDLGSGGGFPGVVLATLLAERPGARVRLVESNNKKCAFLRAALAELEVRGEVFPLRIEKAVSQWTAPQVVTARAVAPLFQLVALIEPWLVAGTRALFHKGEEYQGEIKQTHDTWNLDLVEHPSMIDPRGVVLEIVGIKRHRP